ncbi:MAG: ATP-binding protein [Ktedonobacteraceae bacterium]
MANQKDPFPSGHIRLYSEREADERKQNTCAPGCICPVCGGAGRLRIDILYGDPSFGKSVLCSCVEERQTSLRQQQRRQEANLGAFRDSTFKTFNPRLPGVQEAFQTSIAFAVNPRGWLLLMGPSGSGKTHLATAIANQRLDSGAAVFYTTVPDLLDALKGALMSSEKYTELFSWVREVELLVLDDLGAHQPSVWSSEKLLQLLDYRTALALPTIITAIVKELQGLDERLRSRLTDSQLVTTVLFNNAHDYRPRKLVVERKRGI